MGYGVYSDDFNQTGGVILVDGPLNTDEDYKEYVNRMLEENRSIHIVEALDGDWDFHIDDNRDAKFERDAAGAYSSREEAIERACDSIDVHFYDRESFSRNQYNEFNEDLLEVVRGIGVDIGFDASELRGFRSRNAGFDKDFSELLSKDMVSVGWRSWQHDFVIGVGANKETWQDLLDPEFDNSLQLLLQTGRSPARFKDQYAEGVTKLHELINLTLLCHGIQTSYRTSGYSSCEHVKPDNIGEKIEALTGEVKHIFENLKPGVDVSLVEMRSDERTEIVDMLTSLPLDDVQDAKESVLLKVPVYNHSFNTVNWFDPIEDELIADSIPNHAKLDFDMVAYMADARSEENLSVIPRNDETEEWFRFQQNREFQRGRRMGIIVSGEEYSVGAKCDFEVAYDDVLARGQSMLVAGKNLANGIDMDRVALKVLADKCSALVSELSSRTDEDSVEMLKGIQAVGIVANAAQVQPGRDVGADLAAQINRAFDFEGEAKNVEKVVLVKQKRPTLAP